MQSEKVGSKNHIEKGGEIENALKRTDLYLDLGNYKEMSQLALSKKIPKWKRIYEDIGKYSSPYYRFHLKKYCSECDENVIFDFSLMPDGQGRNKPWRSHNKEFWKAFRLDSKRIIDEAEDWYRSQKEILDQALKVKMDKHQSADIRCDCGGHYSVRNKQKHFATKKHILFIQSLEK